jgi:high-affinity iron transporter
MLATFVIGLREGLEAALIVGIIAAFLRKNGKSLGPMWLGVGLAIALSIAVGVGLDMVEEALPQAAQEGLEAVIGAVAVFFVTGMILWMNAHARDLKGRLEADAAAALSQAGVYALASMAFLAVLREGFETSVFLLATFSAAQSAALAAAGAVIGLALAVVIGWGIYAGGVKINLGRFFRITGAFLILVAAGLVITSLRTAHEAGWLNAGQQRVMDLSWLVTPGTVQSALITGVLGIPADPRLVEAIGWLLYLVPVALVIYWPASRRLRPAAAAQMRLAIAAALAAVAIALAALYPSPVPRLPAEAPLVTATGTAAGTAPRQAGTARLGTADDGTTVVAVTLAGAPSADRTTTLPLPAADAAPAQHDGIAATAWVIEQAGTPAGAPATLTLDQVTDLAGGRLPMGLSPQNHPGPFTAKWTARATIRVWAAGGILLDADGRGVTAVTLTGGGLYSARTLVVRAGPRAAADWHVSDAYRRRAAAEAHRIDAAHTERAFWARSVPAALILVALVLALPAGRILLRRSARAGSTESVSTPGRRPNDTTAKGALHARY